MFLLRFLLALAVVLNPKGPKGEKGEKGATGPAGGTRALFAGSITFPETVAGDFAIAKLGEKLYKVTYAEFPAAAFPVVTPFGAGIGAIQVKNITRSSFEVATTSEGAGSGFAVHVAGV